MSSLGLPFSCISAEDVRAGVLRKNRPKVLLVPGGWAKLKSHCLQESGMEEIRAYVRDGGWYIGFCGGAGLGLTPGKERVSLSLCPWKRTPPRERLPNFSGRVRAELALGPPFPFTPRQDEINLPVWWPAQFCEETNGDVRVLARYIGPAEDFWVSDLDVGSVTVEQLSAWEKIYNIPLRPERIAGEPCIVGGLEGRGGYILSYAHLETPQNPQANALLIDLLAQIASVEPDAGKRVIPSWDLARTQSEWDDPALGKMRSRLEDLIRLGSANFLLTWREPWLLAWRRGIPGLAVNSLLACVVRLGRDTPSPALLSLWKDAAPDLERNMTTFVLGMREYLLEERLLLAKAASSPESSASEKLQQVRDRLVGPFPGYGGLYKTLIQVLDAACLAAFR